MCTGAFVRVRRGGSSGRRIPDLLPDGISAKSACLRLGDSRDCGKLFIVDDDGMRAELSHGRSIRTCVAKLFGRRLIYTQRGCGSAAGVSSWWSVRTDRRQSFPQWRGSLACDVANQPIRRTPLTVRIIVVEGSGRWSSRVFAGRPTEIVNRRSSVTGFALFTRKSSSTMASGRCRRGDASSRRDRGRSTDDSRLSRLVGLTARLPPTDQG
jgi:hypothetical protein